MTVLSSFSHCSAHVPVQRPEVSNATVSCFRSSVLRNRIRQQQHPNAVLRIKLNGVTQEESTINFAMLYIAVYFLFIILGTLINTACGVDFITSLTASATVWGNVGPGFGEVGSMESFAAMPGVMKFSSTALMLFGRLEIFGLIQLFMIKWWV